MNTTNTTTTNTTTQETAVKYAIKLTSTRTRKIKFLHSHRSGLRARITTTSEFANARKFATEADAQEFINKNAYNFGYKFEVAS
jgi:hypothetical protein